MGEYGGMKSSPLRRFAAAESRGALAVCKRVATAHSVRQKMNVEARSYVTGEIVGRLPSIRVLNTIVMGKRAAARPCAASPDAEVNSAADEINGRNR